MKTKLLATILFLLAAGPMCAPTAYGQSPLTPSVLMGGMVSAGGTGSPGSWSPLTGTGGTVVAGTPHTLAGLLYSTDGTGNPGTWAYWTGASGSGTVSPGTGSIGSPAVYSAATGTTLVSAPDNCVFTATGLNNCPIGFTTPVGGYFNILGAQGSGSATPTLFDWVTATNGTGTITSPSSHALATTLIASGRACSVEREANGSNYAGSAFCTASTGVSFLYNSPALALGSESWSLNTSSLTLGLLIANTSVSGPAFIGTGSTPTCVMGAAAGTTSGAACTSITGTNVSGRVTVTTGTGTIASAVLFTITWAGSPISSAPNSCPLQATSVNAIGQVAMDYPSYPTTTGLVVNVAGSAVTPSTVYTYSYGPCI